MWCDQRYIKRTYRNRRSFLHLDSNTKAKWSLSNTKNMEPYIQKTLLVLVSHLKKIENPLCLQMHGWECIQVCIFFTKIKLQQNVWYLTNTILDIMKHKSGLYSIMCWIEQRTTFAYVKTILLNQHVLQVYIKKHIWNICNHMFP